MGIVTGQLRVDVPGDQGVSTAVVEAVSDRTETPVLDLPPVYDVVDPDALDVLFEGRETHGAVTFRYAGQVVTVRSDRTIEVDEAT